MAGAGDHSQAPISLTLLLTPPVQPNAIPSSSEVSASIEVIFTDQPSADLSIQGLVIQKDPGERQWLKGYV